MNENEVTLTFVAVEPEPDSKCFGCAFEEVKCSRIDWVKAICRKYNRDGRNVIFKIKEQK